MKKLVLLGAVVAMVVVTAAPAIAQVGQGFSERRVTSGSASPKTEISNKGNNVNLCTDLLQAAQTGNVANEQGALQYESKADDIGFSGSSVELTPAATAECTQTIEQRPRLARLRPRLPRPRQRLRLARLRPRQRLRSCRRPVVWLARPLCWVLVLGRCWWLVASSLAGSSAKKSKHHANGVINTRSK